MAIRFVSLRTGYVYGAAYRMQPCWYFADSRCNGKNAQIAVVYDGLVNGTNPPLRCPSRSAARYDLD